MTELMCMFAKLANSWSNYPQDLLREHRAELKAVVG
jgi:hypothetical protein